MAEIDDSGDVFPAVYQLATTDPGIGGPPNDLTGDGTLNRPLRHLAQRTAWLKTRLDALILAGTQAASTVAAGIVQLSDSVSSTATDKAATANAVKVVQDNANSRVPQSRSVSGGGLVTGGGALGSDRTLTVNAASPADAVAGTRADVAMTPIATKAVLDDRLAGISALGVGQSWQNMIGSRTGGVSYQNTTGKPIMVAVKLNNPGGGGHYVQVSADGVTWVNVASISQNEYDCTSFIVPASHHYRTTAAGDVALWSELR